MKRILVLALISLFVCCKKENKTILVPSNEDKNVMVSKPIKDTFSIVGNKIWIRETPKSGKVVFTLDDGAICNVLEKGIKDTISDTIDFWYKIETNHQIGWVFGSQTSKSQHRILRNDFEVFLKDFLSTCFIAKNTDSLLHYKSPIIYKYIHKKIGFTRYHNPGITCIPQEYNKQNYQSKNYPKIDLQFYPDNSPKDGFCDKSTSNNGIYYTKINDLPKFPVFVEADDNFKMVPIKTMSEYKNAPKMEVVILHDKWIIKYFYFINVAGKWWLTLVDDCDCSA